MTDVNYARLAYDAYRDDADGKTFDGRDMPEYGSLGDDVQRHWAAAVQAILQYQTIGDTEVAQETVPPAAAASFSPSSDPLNPTGNHNTAYSEAPDADERGYVDSDVATGDETFEVRG